MLAAEMAHLRPRCVSFFFLRLTRSTAQDAGRPAHFVTIAGEAAARTVAATAVNRVNFGV